jgi:hypothetical protein
VIPANRKLLGRNATFASRETIWQTDDGFEVETNIHYEISKRRVLFDDVLLVTIHRTSTPVYLAFTALFGLFFIGLGAMVLSLPRDAWPAAIPFFVIGAPSLVAFFLRLIYGLDVVTIFGRRSKAAIRFAMRKQRAREIYGQVCAAVRAAQRTGEITEAASIPNPTPPDVPQIL